MSFQPYPTRSGYLALGLAILAGGAAVLLAGWLPAQSDPPTFFKLLLGMLGALGLAGAAFYWAAVAFKLEYRLSRNGLAIQGGFGQQRIPIAAIEKIVAGQTVTEPLEFRGLNLAGLRLGWAESAAYGRLKFTTTAPLAHSLLVVTAGQGYVISPDQPERFLHAWQERRALGPTQLWQEDVRRAWPFNIPQLTDPLTWGLLGSALLLGLALLGYISLSYPDFPQAMPVHFDSLGRADRIAAKSELFILPLAGGLVWLIDAVLGSLVYARQRLGAYLLWGSAAVTQLCLWVALLTITGG